jgi:hypothetical protein
MSAKKSADMFVFVLRTSDVVVLVESVWGPLDFIIFSKVSGSDATETSFTTFNSSKCPYKLLSIRASIASLGSAVF